MVKRRGEVYLVKDSDGSIKAVRWILFELEEDGSYSVRDIREYDATTETPWSADMLVRFFLEEDGDLDPKDVTYPAGFEPGPRARTLAGQVRACLTRVLASTTP